MYGIAYFNALFILLYLSELFAKTTFFHFVGQGKDFYVL